MRDGAWERLTNLLPDKEVHLQTATRLGHKLLPQILIAVDDLADQKKVVMGVIYCHRSSSGVGMFDIIALVGAAASSLRSQVAH